MISFMRSR